MTGKWIMLNAPLGAVGCGLALAYAPLTHTLAVALIWLGFSAGACFGVGFTIWRAETAITKATEPQPNGEEA